MKAGVKKRGRRDAGNETGHHAGSISLNARVPSSHASHPDQQSDPHRSGSGRSSGWKVIGGKAAALQEKGAF